ncbi:MAG: hypothetical protein WCP96_20970 [Methylococcaceae bacterium]
MKTINQFKPALLVASLACVFSTPSQAGLLINGGFESGFSGWTRADQIGSEGTFFEQTGTSTPVNGFPVPVPHEGSHAAMTDAQGPGSHVLYQDFSVANGVMKGSVGFSLFLHNYADNYSNPSTLDFASTNLVGALNLNQQARVDILSASEDPFSVTVLQNLFQTKPGDVLVSGYDTFLFDISPLLQAHQGELLRLRFAETDNVNLFNFGVDNVSFNTPVPLPPSFIMTVSGLAGLFWGSRRQNKLLPG